MQQLQPQDTSGFLARFNAFNDGVLRLLVLVYPSTGRTRVATLHLSTQDTSQAAGNQWVNVQLRVSGLSHFCFSEGDKESYQILSNGLHITYERDHFYLDFGYLVDQPEDVAEYAKSRSLLIGKQVAWCVEEYAEEIARA